MKILVGVTGGISAYKVCDVISGLKGTGHEVKVVMTESAQRFITVETLAVLSQNEVFTDDHRDVGGVVTHIELTKWADLFAIVPATGNTINKLRNGFADNLLTTIARAFTGTVVIAPARNPNMWDKIDMVGLIDRVDDVIGPVEGLMACGDFGVGKLESPRKIVERINEILKLKLTENKN